MEVELLCVCRRPPAWVTTASADYARRLLRHIDLSFRYVTPGHDGATAAARRRDEAQRVRKALPRTTHLVALDERGQQCSSAELARWLGEWRERHDHVTLLIGGPDGLDAELLELAASRWSLSRLTLPHLLVQVLVAEQIYRAWTIIDGHPYHRD